MSERAVMSQRGNELAAAFERANEAIIATIEGCSDDQLRATCEGETWPVAVTAHHVAAAYPEIYGMVRQIANAEPLEPFTSEQLDAHNAEHAREQHNVSREEALALLRQNGVAAAAGIRTLTDEQLERSAALVIAGGQVFTAAQLIEGGLIGHPTDHCQSIKAAITGQAATV